MSVDVSRTQPVDRLPLPAAQPRDTRSETFPTALRLDAVERSRVKRLLETSLTRTIAWVKAHNYRAYEPADGNSSFLFPLTGGRVPAMRVLQQVVLRSPVNIRPLLGVKRHESAIGRGYMAWGYLKIAACNRSPEAIEDAKHCLAWLMANRSDHPEFCWGDPYEYATRSGRRRADAPLLIWTSFIGLVFLEAHRLLGDEQYLRVAESVGRWMLALPVEQTDTGVCLSYVTFRQSSIHNANAMGAAFLARLWQESGEQRFLDLARRAMTYTCTRQRPDGSWFYAEEPKFHWVDNFHTGYNLSALNVYRAAAEDRSFDQQFESGAQYYLANFVEADGRPRYFHNRTQPVDIQCAAQSIETLCELASLEARSLALAVKVAQWTMANMQAADGHFIYRHLGWWKVSTPMLHWGQGTMVKALAVLLNAVERSHA